MGTVIFSDLAFVIIAMLLTHCVHKVKTGIKKNILAIVLYFFYLTFISRVLTLFKNSSAQMRALAFMDNFISLISLSISSMK